MGAHLLKIPVPSRPAEAPCLIDAQGFASDGPQGEVHGLSFRGQVVALHHQLTGALVDVDVGAGHTPMIHLLRGCGSCGLRGREISESGSSEQLLIDDHWPRELAGWVIGTHTSVASGRFPTSCSARRSPLLTPTRGAHLGIEIENQVAEVAVDEVEPKYPE